MWIRNFKKLINSSNPGYLYCLNFEETLYKILKFSKMKWEDEV